MPSTFTTDPIGPRSIDEMLDVVYTRAGNMRRRRAVRRVGVAAVAVVVGLAGVVTVRGGDPEARVRLVDRPPAEEEASAPASDGNEAPPPSAGAHTSGQEQVSQGADESHEVDATVKQPQGTPPVQSPKRPPVETWAEDTDALNDATPNDWYFDIAATSMQFDGAQVVFTTRYRVPDAPVDQARQSRVLESVFEYEGDAFTVAVRESANALGTVFVDNHLECTDCVPRFDTASGTLFVSVPLATLNQAIKERNENHPALGPGADIWSVRAVTSRSQGDLPPVQADSSATSGVG